MQIFETSYALLVNNKQILFCIPNPLFDICCHYVQLAELYAFETSEVLAEVFEFADLSFEYYHFKAIVVVKVDVGRGNGLQEIVVLQFQEFVGKVGSVMVVDKEDASDGV